MNIYVGNLSYEVTEDDLKQAFGAFGQVETVKIIKDRWSGQPRGFGFVEMPEVAEAHSAISGLNGKDLKGRTVKVTKARSRSESRRGEGRGGGRRDGWRRSKMTIDSSSGPIRSPVGAFLFSIWKGEIRMQTRRGRWFWALVAALAFVSIALLASALENQPSEGKVAVVNGSVITQEDFDREMGRVQQQLSSRGKPLTDSQIPEIKKEVLENLINRELVYQESQRKAIKVDEAAINEQVTTLKRRFPDEDEFKTALIKANLSEAGLKALIKREVAIQQFIDTYIAKKATVSDQEIKALYEGRPGLFKQPEQVRASHILIKVDPKADESQRAVARKKIEKIQQKLQQGEDFAALAKEFSQGPSSVKGGDLGYFGRGQMVKPFEKAAFGLMPGDVSDIVETKFGYHLIKVIERRPETTIAFEDIKDRLGRYLMQEKVRREVSLYVQKLKEKAKVERFLTEDQ